MRLDLFRAVLSKENIKVDLHPQVKEKVPQKGLKQLTEDSSLLPGVGGTEFDMSLDESWFNHEEASFYITDNTWVCPQCGSPQVEQTFWVRLNDGKITSEVGNEEQDYWCGDCQKHLIPILHEEWIENNKNEERN